MSKCSLRSFASCFPASAGRVLALSIVALLLAQHVPLTHGSSCCNPQHCHCAEETCTCPGCDQHDGAAQASNGPTLRPCGASDALPLVTFTAHKSLTAGTRSLTAPFLAVPVQLPYTLTSSQRLADEVFRPPKRSIGSF